jgi:hypothetical protein
VFSASFLFNFRYGLTQQEFPERRVSRGFDLSSLGFSQNLTNLIDKQYAAIPNVNVSPLTAISGTEQGDGSTSSLTHSFNGNFTWLKGDHNLRFGPELRVYREFRNRFTNDVSPRFDFNSEWGRGPFNNSPAQQSGPAMVAMLLGIPNGYMTRSGSYAEQDKYLGLYIQDDWKISRNLTLNLGLRAEHESPITERYNRSATHFAFDTANPIEAQARANYAAQAQQLPELPLSAFSAKGGLEFAGIGSNPREYWDGEFITWMPRIGFAYTLNKDTVLRGGYGLFYGSIGINKTNSQLAGFSRQTDMVPTVDNGQTFIATLENPFPNGLLPPLGAEGGLSTNLGQEITQIFPKERKQPYSQKWSFTVQRQLPQSFVVQVSYVGSRATRIPVNRNINSTPAQYLSTKPTRDQSTINSLGASFTNPFFGLIPSHGRTITRANLLRPYPHFANISLVEPIGYSWLHSMQAQTERRFSGGFTFQAAYTWSKAMEATEFLNASDLRPYESLAGIDRLHRLVGSGQWDFPYGRKMRYGSDANKVVAFFLGNWRLNGMFQRQSGQPLGFGQALFIGDSSTIVLPSSERNTDRWFNTSVFNKTIGERLEQNIRTAPLRYSNIRADSQRRIDLSLIKYFYLNETMNFQFRAETFNALNTPVLRGPGTDPYNTSFGRVTAQEPPRSWQFSLQLQW